MDEIPQAENRRQWLEGCARYTILGCLAAGGAALLGRRPTPATGQDCRKAVACRDCALLAGCRLPRATYQKAKGRRR